MKKASTGILWTLITGFLLLLSSHARADNETQTLRIASAANFYPTLKTLSELYQENNKISLDISSGSSGRIYAQILQGAPFDLFFSADSHRPELLESAGFTVTNSRQTYAIGQLILWHPQIRPAQISLLQRESAQKQAQFLTNILDKQTLNDSFRFLALANPLHAPYGQAAQEALTATGYWQNLFDQQQLAIAANVVQARQFIASGNAQLGFIALSQLTPIPSSTQDSSEYNQHRSQANFTVVPESLYSPVQQQAVVLNNRPDSSSALEFLHWIINDPCARDIIRSKGYKVPVLSTQAHADRDTLAF